MKLLDRLTHLPRDARDTLFLLAVIGWVVLPLAAHLPLWCIALAAGMLAWRGWLTVRGSPLPSRWWLAALLAVTLLATWATHRTLLGRDAGVTLIVVLLALKTLEMRARRDALVVFFLGFFAMLTNFFYSQSLLVAAAMLLALLGLLTALVNAHRPVGRPALRESAWMAGKMALAGAPIMLALFVFFPRFAPLWGMPSDAMQGKTGLSSQMEVGSVAELALDDGIALRVKFDGQPPPQRDLYFRGPVLSRFDGRRWIAWGGSDGFNATPAPGPADLQVSGPAIGYEITLEPNRLPWLLTLDVAGQPPQFPPSVRARMTADMQWVSYRPITDLVRYRAQSHPQFRYGLADWDGRPRRDMREYLRLPAGFNPRTLALAEDLKAQVQAQAGSDAPRALVQAALERLRTGGYTYTLEPGLTGQHSADEFWFDTKAGFCEHISSAFVVLLRAAGVPARIVTGFQGGERNPVDSYWVVRNADAHAWAEVWYADQGWVRVDPTGAVLPGRVGQYQRLRAPDGALAGALNTLSPDTLAWLRANWEAINNRWNQWVLNYTQTRQFDLMRQLGFEAPNWQDLLKVLAILLAAAALGVALWARWERSQHDPWLRLLANARHRLAAAGIHAPAQAPPRELMHHVRRSALPESLRTPLADWLLALERQRYAPGSTPHGASLATLARQLRRLPWPRQN
ncbi:MAG: DUF3488 and transglutaminase-like domain-containing protein [Pseudomonadota bacterium]|nr:DUF3488 and transglutaminase-like domain-containing protein [Pseudomonadota bacterium]